MSNSYFHPTAIIEEGVQIGSNVKIWHHSHVRSGANLEDNVSLGKDVFIDQKVSINNGSRIQNGVSIYQGVNIGKWCFIGPHVVFTNDTYPRAGNKKWNLTSTNIQDGSSIGAGSIIICGVTIGAFSMVGAGSLVTKEMPPFSLSYGQPAITVKKICACGRSSSDLRDYNFQELNDCCYENLNSEMINLAKNLIKK